MATVSLHNLTSFTSDGQTPDNGAVQGVSLEIGDRELAVLAGPTGGGAATILRMIAGLEIAAGEISIGDRRVNDVAPQDRQVAMVFRDGALYPHMSVQENMTFGLKQRKFAAAEIQKRIRDAADILGLDRLLERKPRELTAVQRQRVALGRAVVRQPQIFLFDDPLSGLGLESRAELRTELIKLHQRLETTMIYVTRDPAEAVAMADRLVLLNRGVVEQSGTARALFDAPANLFVAGFLGNPPMNLVHGTLRQERDGLVFLESGDGTIQTRLPAADWPAAKDLIGKPVVLGIRPEDLRIVQVPKGAEKASNSFAALVDVVEPAGGSANLHLSTGEHALICRTAEPLERGEAGRRVRLEMDVNRVQLFDPVTSLRV